MLNAIQPVLDTALDAVVAMRPDGTIAAWNKVAERTFGWPEEDAVGRLMVDLIIPPQHRAAHTEGVARYNRTGEERVLNRRIEITAINREGLEIPVELSITTTSLGGDVIFVGFLRDISNRRKAEAQLKRQAREAQLLFDVTRLAADTSSFEQAIAACLSAICALTSWPVGHALLLKGGGELVSAGVWHEAVEGSAAAMKLATQDIRFTRGVGLPGMILESEQPMWISDADAAPSFARKALGFGAAFGFPIKSEGRITAVLEFFTYERTEPDAELMLMIRTLGEQVGRVLERKRTEEHQRLLINELNHRVKNSLAIVQSIANQTFKSPAEAKSKQAFESRLAALAAAHDLLTAQSWDVAPLADVVRKTSLGCGVDIDRVSFAGPAIQLPPKTAVSMAMALHELCTNAVKYGAFSNATGTVRVTWHVTGAEDAQQLHLEWRESGGPTVTPPTTRGFGSRMIERALAAELQGSVELQFLPAGLRCVVQAPLPTGE